MVKFTLFEVHLDDVDLTANAPFSGSDGEDDHADGDEPAGRDESTKAGSNGKPLSALALLATAVVVALVARKLRKSDEDVVDEDPLEAEAA
ncbi:MAG: hypothetical protein ABEH35_08510 [Haloarculaceae archaeon]